MACLYSRWRARKSDFTAKGTSSWGRRRVVDGCGDEDGCRTLDSICFLKSEASYIDTDVVPPDKYIDPSVCTYLFVVVVCVSIKVKQSRCGGIWISESVQTPYNDSNGCLRAVSKDRLPINRAMGPGACRQVRHFGV